jgi:hypothetical protein
MLDAQYSILDTRTSIYYLRDIRREQARVVSSIEYPRSFDYMVLSIMANIADILELYTDESPGLKVDPVVVLVLSVGFIVSVVALHSTYILFQIFWTIAKPSIQSSPRLLENSHHEQPTENF